MSELQDHQDYHDESAQRMIVRFNEDLARFVTAVPERKGGL